MGRSKTPSAATPAIAYLQAKSIGHTIHTYSAGSEDFGAEAAGEMSRLLGVAPERIFKTLVLATDRPPSGSRTALGVAVLPVTTRLRLPSAARALGCSRASLAPADDVRRSTGYVLGGVSPLGQKRPLATAIDSSALDHETVFCSAGRRGWEVELRPADLVALTDAVLAELAA